MEVLSNIGDWYIERDFTYIRIYGATKAPHLLPKFVPERLVLREIAYQTILHGFNAYLVKEKLKTFISYSVCIGHYGLNNSVFARMEAHAMLEYGLPEGIFRRHDPHGLVAQHAAQEAILWPYSHDSWEDEEIDKRATSWEEVQVRIRQRDQLLTHQQRMALEEQRKKEEEDKKRQADLENKQREDQ